MENVIIESYCKNQEKNFLFIAIFVITSFVILLSILLIPNFPLSFFKLSSKIKFKKSCLYSEVVLSKVKLVIVNIKRLEEKWNNIYEQKLRLNYWLCINVSLFSRFSLSKMLRDLEKSLKILYESVIHESCKIRVLLVFIKSKFHKMYFIFCDERLVSYRKLTCQQAIMRLAGRIKDCFWCQL